MELEFNKLNLKEDDFLVIKVKSEGLTEDQMKNRVFEVRNDEFVKYIEDKGNKVFVTYTGVDFSILRMESSDKLIVYVDVTPFKTEQEQESYLEFIKFKLEGNISEDNLIIIPTKSDVKLAIKKEEVNDEH